VRYQSPLVDFTNERIFARLGFKIAPARRQAGSYRERIRSIYFHDRCRDAASVTGCVVECGVGVGKSLIALLASHDALAIEREFYAFDTFAGLLGVDLSKGDIAHDGYVATSLENVRRYLSSSGDSTLSRRVEFVPGDVRTTTVGFSRPIAVLHLDLDIHEPYRVALANLYPLVQPGGVVMFDEYRDPKFKGATAAIDEALGDDSHLVMEHAPSGKYYLVKPPLSGS
jgi:O-methyltransferase